MVEADRDDPELMHHVGRIKEHGNRSLCVVINFPFAHIYCYLGNEADPTIGGALQEGDARLVGPVSQFLPIYHGFPITADWIPDQMAMASRSPEPLCYRFSG